MCPKCGEALACGWWCPKCKDTLNHIEHLQSFDKAWDDADADLAMKAGISVLAIGLVLLFGLVYRYWNIFGG